MHSLVKDTFPPVWLKQLHLMVHTAVSNGSNVDYKTHFVSIQPDTDLYIEATCTGDMVVNSECYIAAWEPLQMCPHQL